MVPLYQSVLSGLLIGLKGEIAGSLGVYLNNTRACLHFKNGDITTTNIGKDKGSKTGDVGFHLIGNQFNGPINRLNVVPGNGKPANGVANLNQGAYASKFESKVKALSAAGKKLEVRIEPVYRSGNNTTRPDPFRTQYREVGTSRWTTNDFKNQPGG